MRRRAFVAISVGGLGTLAGCVGGGAPGTGGGSPTDEPTSSTGSTPTTGDPGAEADVSVEDVQLQYGVVTPTSPDSIGLSRGETPYLVASVRVDGPLERDEFDLVIGNERYGPSTLDRLYRTSWGGDRWYERGRGSGLLLFEAPAVATERLRLTWPGGERTIDDAIQARLDGNPPRFSASLQLPDTHEGTRAPPVEVEVTNDGATMARFLGALNRTGPLIAYTPVARLSELVPPGETATTSVADRWSGTPDEDRVGDDSPDVTYRLHHGGGEDTARIRLTEPS